MIQPLFEEPISGILIRGPDPSRGMQLRIILLEDGGIGHAVSDIGGMGNLQPDWELMIGVNPAFSLSRLEAAEKLREQQTKIKQKTKP